MIATLPMYNWPEVKTATQNWWQAIARNLNSNIPLTNPHDYVSSWSSPDLLFSQTCGYPFTHALKDRLTLVSTPHYDVDGCIGPNYQSFIFARNSAPLENFRNTIAAVNTADSMSGMLALKLIFAPLAQNGKFFAKAIATGGHVASLQAVQDGRADICAIDAVCVAMAKKYRPDYLEGLVEIARSPMVPTLPYVTKAGNVPQLRAAIAKALDDPELKFAREQLFIAGQSFLKPMDYDVILKYEAAMEANGGLHLI